MTAAVLPMQGRPTASISKSQKPGKARKAQLPAIAPRYQLVSNKSDPTIIARVNVPRTRLPPRSRFGCWCVSFLPFICSWAFRLTFGVQDVSGNRFPSRLDTLFLKLTDMLADTQGQVSTPLGRSPATASIYSPSLFLSRCDEARPECTVRQT